MGLAGNSAKTSPVKAQRCKYKTRLASLELWLQLTWPDVTSSCMESSSQPDDIAHLTQVSNQLFNFWDKLSPSWENKQDPHQEWRITLVHTEQSDLHRYICSGIYMHFITTLRGFFRRQQNLICNRNPSLEEEVYLFVLFSGKKEAEVLLPSQCLWNTVLQNQVSTYSVPVFKKKNAAPDKNYKKLY